MLFKVEMTVNIPSSLPKAEADEIKAKEKAYSQQLQREGKWLHICRAAALSLYGDQRAAVMPTPVGH